jgi:DNA uptake protein ComE-like DNA-binding protein
MWKDYLSFSRREQKGIVVLIVIIILLVGFRLLFPFFLPTSEIESVKLDSLYFTFQPRHKVITPVLVEDNYELSLFDPNNITADILVNMGINSRIANTWHNFLKKGGHFTNPEDLLKIYGLDKATFKQLLPYIKIKKELLPLEIKEEQVDNKKWNIDSLLVPMNNPQDKFLKKNYIPDNSIEINSADTSEWMLLKGIGPVLSKRIVIYRKKLGGFVSYNQLLEVYGIKPEVIEDNKNIMDIDTTLIVPLNINKATIGHLRDHPYLDFYKAQAIVEKRKSKPFKSIEEVLILEPFSDVDWNILQFYLSVE